MFETKPNSVQNSNKTESESSSAASSTIDSEKNPLWFARLQEVLLMHRPFDFCVLLIAVELIFGFVYFHHLGIFATAALLSLIAFMFFIHFDHPNPLFEKIFFPPLSKPIDQTQPNRIRSYSEFSRAISSIHQGFSHYFGHKQLTGIKRAVFGISSFIFALLLKRVAPFWVNFLLVHGILFLPAAILRPWPTKDLPNDDQSTSESLPVTNTTETNQTQGNETQNEKENTTEEIQENQTQEEPQHLDEIPKPVIEQITTPIPETIEDISPTPIISTPQNPQAPMVPQETDGFQTPVTNRNVTFNQQDNTQPLPVSAPNTEPKPKPKFSLLKKKTGNSEKGFFGTPKNSKKGK